jgi:hypothetical protein
MPKKFEEYIIKGIVKKVSPDKPRSKFLINEAKNSFIGLNRTVEKLGIDEYNVNSIIKDCYDIIMELIRAKMLLGGYKAAGNFAHEAEVSYFKALGFTDNEVIFLNEIRFSRNSIVYYGKLLDIEYAKRVFNFTKKIYPKLINLVENET